MVMKEELHPCPFCGKVSPHRTDLPEEKEKLIGDPAWKRVWCKSCKDWHDNPSYNPSANQQVCQDCDDDGVAYPESWPGCPNCGSNSSEENDDDFFGGIF